MKPYVQKYLLFISIIFVIIGGINSGIIGLLNLNPINLLSRLFRFQLIKTIIYVLIGFSSIYLLYNIKMFLSLINIDTIYYDYHKLKEKIPINWTKSIDTEAPPYSKIVYWTNQKENAELNKGNPWLLYQNYNNAGIALTNNNGLVTLKIIDYPKEKNDNNEEISKLLYYQYFSTT